jgi:hypothetical protein
MSEQDEKARSREIAENEEKRRAVGAVRVSSWAIMAAIVAALIVIGLVWPWIRPR